MIWNKVNCRAGENICNEITDKKNVCPEYMKNYKSLWQTPPRSGEGIWIDISQKRKTDRPINIWNDSQMSLVIREMQIQQMMRGHETSVIYDWLIIINNGNLHAAGGV